MWYGFRTKLQKKKMLLKENADTVPTNLQNMGKTEVNN